MKELEYGIADKAWQVVLGCDNTIDCWKRCWAKRTVARLACSPNAKVREAHYPLVKLLRPWEQIKGEVGLAWTGVLRLNEAHLTDPLKWRKPALVASGFHGDWALLDFDDITQVMAVMAVCDEHQFMTLTKRPRLILGWCETKSVRAGKVTLEVAGNGCASGIGYNGPLPLPNVHLGISITNQSDLTERLPAMKALHELGWKLHVWYEPATGPVDWRGCEFLELIICGGESGPEARPMHPEWAGCTRNWCAAHGVGFLFKQWGAWAPKANFANFAEWDKASAHGLVLLDGVSSCVEGRDTPDPEMGLTCADLDGNDYAAAMARVTKKSVGCLLDGREHKQLPPSFRGGRA